VVRFFDGETVRQVDNAGCEFEYRGSVFKRNKERYFRGLALDPADGASFADRG
jgi:UDP-N-acetylenolpyruvoylglucosamine reductase